MFCWVQVFVWFVEREGRNNCWVSYWSLAVRHSDRAKQRIAELISSFQ